MVKSVNHAADEPFGIWCPRCFCMCHPCSTGSNYKCTSHFYITTHCAVREKDKELYKRAISLWQCYSPLSRHCWEQFPAL